MALQWSVLLLFPAAYARFVQIGDGQCNGGVGGTGEHYCMVGGSCNENGVPVTPPTQPGTRCPGVQEYLLCTEDTSINESSCRAACEANSSCVGFLVSRHEAKNSGRCELHTKVIEFAAEALDCYTYIQNVFTNIGRGACRTKALTVGGPQNGTHYGYMQVYWVDNLAACKQACRDSSTPCVGVEYHNTLATNSQYKCEVHFEELSASQMSVFECHAEPNCQNAYTCGPNLVHKDGASAVRCSPNSNFTFATCSDQLCCKSTSVGISAAGPGPSPWLAAMFGLGGVFTSLSAAAAVF